MKAGVRRAGRAVIIAAHLAVALCLVGAWLLPLKRFSPRRWPGQRNRLTRWWMRRLLRCLGVKLEVTGTPAVTPALLAANHISWLDIPCLLACLDTSFVAKTEVARWPLIGLLAGQVGTLFLARGTGAGTAANRMTFALAAGERVAIFPEGTSTDGRDVRPFHARLYQAAIRAAVPVQAVAIRYPRDGEVHPLVPFVNDDDFASHLWRLLGECGITARLHFCAPLTANDATRRVLADVTRRQIAAVLTPGRAFHDRERAAGTARRSPEHTRAL